MAGFARRRVFSAGHLLFCRQKDFLHQKIGILNVFASLISLIIKIYIFLRRNWYSALKQVHAVLPICYEPTI